MALTTDDAAFAMLPRGPHMSPGFTEEDMDLVNSFHAWLDQHGVHAGRLPMKAGRNYGPKEVKEQITVASEVRESPEGGRRIMLWHLYVYKEGLAEGKGVYREFPVSFDTSFGAYALAEMAVPRCAIRTLHHKFDGTKIERTVLGGLEMEELLL